MAKKKSSKKKELVILIRIPDADSRDGKATLTIQRGELGHMSEFDYKGLTLKGNIAEAVGTALVKLMGVERTPPPDFSTETPKTDESVSTSTDSSEAADEDESVSTSTDTLTPDEADEEEIEDEKPPESPEIDENPPQNAENPTVSTQTAKYDTDTSPDENVEEIAPESPKKVSVSVVSKTDDTSTDKQQMSLF
jgi:hypothetical protein